MKSVKVKKMPIKIRHPWLINPRTRIHGKGKKAGYNRNAEKNNWKKETA